VKGVLSECHGSGEQTHLSMSPWTATDIETLEKVQEKAIRNTAGLKGKTYEEKCKEVGLETLAMRRNMQDLMQTFKIMHGFESEK
jgi:hypothetical protein